MFIIVKFTIVLNSNMSSKILKKINNIELLRDIVIIFVVLYRYTSHYSQNYFLRLFNYSLIIAKHGWTNIDIFCIVSEYYIARINLLKIKS